MKLKRNKLFDIRLRGGPWDGRIVRMPYPGTTAWLSINGWSGRYLGLPPASLQHTYRPDLDQPINSHWIEAEDE